MTSLYKIVLIHISGMPSLNFLMPPLKPLSKMNHITKRDRLMEKRKLQLQEMPEEVEADHFVA